MKLVLSFPFGVLGEISQNEFYKQLHSAITEIVNEEDVSGVQIYPAQWPRKVLITVKDQTVKESLLISGLNLRGQHIDLKDEGLDILRITMKDAMIDWEDEKIEEIMRPYGNILKIENEYVHIDNKVTRWKSGTRVIYMTNVDSVIPNRLSTMDGDKGVTVSIWYNRPKMETENPKCFKCGDMHNTNSCYYTKKVCYVCKGDHEIKECPKNDGSRTNKEVFCFMTEKSPLSNFNQKFPIKIRGRFYNCNEQFIQCQKAELFGDWVSHRDIMSSKDPREMKQLGKRIKGYKDVEWKRHSYDVIMECVRSKVYAHREIQEYLLATGDKMIGEGTPDPHFGVGIHIGDSRILNPDEWAGKNVMGKALMEVRSEIKMLQSARDDDIHGDHSKETSVLASTPLGGAMGNHAAPMVCSPVVTDNSMWEKDASHDNRSKFTALLLGDSNAKGINLDNSLFDVTKVCRSGAALQDVTELMEECTKGPGDVDAVLVQLGTCNWSADHTDKVEKHDEVYRDYVEAINSISLRYPHADLVVSSVPKRLPQNQNMSYVSAVNAEISALNSMLEALDEDEENILFVDNDHKLTNDGEPNPDMYVNSDMTGVHLNQTGLAHVSRNIASELSDICQKSNSNPQWHTLCKNQTCNSA
jgi:ribA/ribD-fused uncharacterized protein